MHLSNNNITAKSPKECHNLIFHIFSCRFNTITTSLKAVPGLWLDDCMNECESSLSGFHFGLSAVTSPPLRTCQQQFTALCTVILVSQLFYINIS